MSWINTYEQVLEVATKNNIGLAQYILTYGGNYTPEVTVKIAAVISEINLQRIIDQYMKFSDDCAQQAAQANDEYWKKYYSEHSLEMAARAARWAIAKPLPAKE